MRKANVYLIQIYRFKKMAERETKRKRGPYRRKPESETEEVETILHQDVSESLESELKAEDVVHNPSTDTREKNEDAALTVDYDDESNVKIARVEYLQGKENASSDDEESFVNVQIPDDILPETNSDNKTFDLKQLFLSNQKCCDPDLDETINQLFEDQIESEVLEDDFVTDFIDDREDMVDASVLDSDDADTQFLYPGSSITVGAFMLLVTLFATKHNLIGDAIIQLLNIISVALPNDHGLCKSLRDFKKFFSNLKNPLVKHYYCNTCLGYLSDQYCNKCPYPLCEAVLNEKGKSYFLEMPVDVQIKTFFSQKNFYNKLQGRFLSQPRGQIYEDIYDGKLYRSHAKGPSGLLSSPDNLSFTFNTDGAPVFKSSKVSIWPLFLIINELPYEVRMRQENMLLAGLWFGKQKPFMGTYLYPFYNSFKKLSEGIQCCSPERGTFTSRSILLCGTADLPARSLICNGVQFNGAFSCWKCQQRGETAKVGKGHTHVFPFIQEDPKGPKRNPQNVLSDAQQALNLQDSGSTNFVVNGIKGPSWLSFFPQFDIVDGIAIDYMHGVLLGIQKLLLNLWFGSKHKSKQFSIFNKLSEVDSRLQSIKPTLDITRLPRSIENDLKYWKASEFRSFLLFFGAPVLFGILDDSRFTHYLLLVNAMHILLKCGSNDEEIDRAEDYLFKFCNNFAQLYDQCYMTLNLHQLVHLADCVRSLGPLYTTSCFSFEDKNGLILKMIRGTQNIDNQIITGVSFVQKLPELKRKCIEEDTELEVLYNSIQSPNLLKRGEKIKNGVFILGACNQKPLLKDEYEKICEYLGSAPLTESFKMFNRVELHGQIVYGTEYARMTKRDNSTIIYYQGTNICFGRVRFFMSLNTDQVLSEIVAVVESLLCPNFDKTSSLLAVKLSKTIKIVPLEDIIENCMFITIVESQNCFVCRLPNRLERD